MGTIHVQGHAKLFHVLLNVGRCGVAPQKRWHLVAAENSACDSQAEKFDVSKYLLRRPFAEIESGDHVLILAAERPALIQVAEAVAAAKLADDFGRTLLYTNERVIVEYVQDVCTLESWGVEFHVGDLDDEIRFKHACEGVDTVISCLGENRDIPLETWAKQAGIRRFFRSKCSADTHNRAIVANGGNVSEAQSINPSESISITRCLLDNFSSACLAENAARQHNSRQCVQIPRLLQSTGIARDSPGDFDPLSVGLSGTPWHSKHPMSAKGSSPFELTAVRNRVNRSLKGLPTGSQRYAPMLLIVDLQLAVDDSRAVFFPYQVSHDLGSAMFDPPSRFSTIHKFVGTCLESVESERNAAFVASLGEYNSDDKVFDFLTASRLEDPLRRHQMQYSSLLPVRSRDLIGVNTYIAPLCFAVLMGCTDVVRWLARAGADINRKDHGTGLTPLQYAVITRSPEMVRTLLTCGATANIENDAALNHPHLRWVDRIIATIAHSTNAGDSPTEIAPAPAECGGMSSTINGRKRKHASGYQAGVAPISISQAFTPRSIGSDDWIDQSDEDDEPKKRKRAQVNRGLAESCEERTKFACPYAKYDPGRFGDVKCCGLTGYDSIPRLKDHLNRKHRLYSCERCGSTSFKDKDELNDHIAADYCVKLVQSQWAYSDGYNTRQADKIEGRWRGQDAGKKWEKIYRILFGVDDSDSVPFPYFETRAQLQYENWRLQEALREALMPRYSAEELSRRMDTVMLGIRRDFSESRHRIQDVSNLVLINDDETAPTVVEALHDIPGTTSCIHEHSTDEARIYQEFRIEPEPSDQHPHPNMPEEIDSGHELNSWPPDGFGNIFDLLNDETLALESSASSIDRILSNDSMSSTELETSIEDATCDVTTQEADLVDKI